MKILFVSRDYKKLTDGGMIVTYRNLCFLKKMSSLVDEITIPRASLLTLAHNYLLQESYGATYTLTKELCLCLKNRYDLIWFDGSIYGKYLQICKRSKTPIICFYHNIEQDFYRQKANATKSILDKLMIPYVTKNETLSTTLSDYRFVLNKRDGESLKGLYGFKEDFIFPTSLPKKDNGILRNAIDKKITPYLLFIGSNFYANVEGLTYFFNEVAEKIDNKIVVIGSVCNAFTKDLLPKNVELMGRVEDLTPYYANANAVISPILSGSGTKTKTIEALNYGKKIIGSPEALMGIPPSYYSQIGTLCKTTEDYINAINNLTEEKLHEPSLKVFEELYSDEHNYELLEAMISNILKR